MFEARHQDDVTIIRGVGELTKDELSAIAAIARRARDDGRRVVVDLKQVTHLHYGLRAAGASRYVRDLVHAGGAGGHLELFEDVEAAFRAA